MNRAVLLDTSFFVRFLDDDDELFKNADDYFRYFLINKITMMISTISIAEYCIKGDVSELPLKNLHVLPFNYNHALRTGTFAEIVFKKKDKLDLNNRNIIPNDSKLFAQADSEEGILYYLTSDKRSKKIFDLLKEHTDVNFNFLNLYDSCNHSFEMIDFPAN